MKICIKWRTEPPKFILLTSGQVWEIDSLIGMSRYKEGLEVYQNTEKLLFDEMGVAPSERLLKRFKLMGERTSQAEGALSDIKERLREKEAAVGAYFCPFPSFVDIYHVFSRMVERSGLSVFVMLCTLDYKADHVSEEKEREKSELLRQAIQSSIRKGDFYTRYNVLAVYCHADRNQPGELPLVSKRIAKNSISSLAIRNSLRLISMWHPLERCVKWRDKLWSTM